MRCATGPDWNSCATSPPALLPFPPIGKALNFFLLEAEEGRVVFQGTPKFDFYNPIGSVHGGWTCTLLDSCMSCAVQTTLKKGFAYTTGELKVNMVRPLTKETGPVRAEGKVIHPGRQLATAEGRIFGPDGKLYAHGTTTCLIFQIPAEGQGRGMRGEARERTRPGQEFFNDFHPSRLHPSPKRL